MKTCDNHCEYRTGSTCSQCGKLVRRDAKGREMNFINRDYNRTEHDDFVLNVEPYLTETTETVPVYHDGTIIGWKIKGTYE